LPVRWTIAPSRRPASSQRRAICSLEASIDVLKAGKRGGAADIGRWIKFGEKILVSTTNDAAAAPSRPASNPEIAPKRRSPPKAFCVLLPVWGEAFIANFLRESLPTLLAEGNLPALSKTLPTRFVFLTRKRNEETIRAHPAYLHLQAVCEVEFLPIDDLIMSGNHTTTITLAWERAVRREGQAMLDICFVFLVSDYVMANGSLATIARLMMGGTSAIQAGNFQLDEEVAAPWLQKRLATAGTSLALGAREMVRWGLSSLHPATVANIVNYPLCHNSHTNRLFWHVDRGTLIGRFYLLHQICIRPERVDFVVGSSSDYSFVPEMCPSGNVTTITDSDDYFVAEIQPYGHEAHFIRFGPDSTEHLADSLSEWTTVRHRLNAEETIVFHAGELPARLPSVVAQADNFIKDLAPRLSAPQPHRNHPYWIGAIAALNAAIGERQQSIVAKPPSISARLLRQLRMALIGYPPLVTRAHPRWRDYKNLLAVCEELTASSSQRLLICVTELAGLTDVLRRRVPDIVSLSLRDVALGQATTASQDNEKFDTIVIETSEGNLARIEKLLQPVLPLLRPEGQIILAVFSNGRADDPELLVRSYAQDLTSLLLAGLLPTQCLIGSVSCWRWWVNRNCAIAANDFFQSRGRRLLSALRMAQWGLIVLATNFLSSFRADRTLAPGRAVSSVLIRLSVDPVVN
jgi:hypothetical protein